MAAATIPVLLMNPGGERMARRMPPRHKSGPKKGQFRKGAATATRRKTAKRRTRRTATARAAAPTRRRRRRRNPAQKMDIKSIVIAALGGGVVGGVNYALDGVEKVTIKQQAFGIAGGGLVLGLLAAMMSKPLGLGIAGGALGLGGYKLANIYVKKEAPAASLSQAAYDPYGRYLGAPAQMYARSYPQLQGTTAELSAIEAQLGATTAELSAVEADLGAVFANYDLG